MTTSYIPPQDGESLMQYRIRRGWKRARWLARDSGVNQSVISHFENGKRVQTPSAERLAKFLGITLEDMNDLIENGRSIGKDA